MLTIKKILQMAEVHAPTCVSIYLPTHKKGMPVLNQEDSLILKNIVAQLKKEITKRFKSESEIDMFLKPLLDKVGDEEFWRNQDEGLALFIDKSQTYQFKLAGQVVRNHYISSSYILWPLIEFVNDREEFFLLGLNSDSVKLYRGSKFQLWEEKVQELDDLEYDQVVGTDHKQKSLQYHGAESGFDSTIYHGHGEGKDDVKEEILKYYRKVDTVVNQVLKDRTTPLILSGLDHLIGLYRKANKYKHIAEAFVSGNPQGKSIKQLHQEAWQIIAPNYERARKQKAEMIEENLGTRRAESDINHLVPAALEGKIDTLFIQNKKDIWGIYDPIQRKVEIHDAPSKSNTSLTNLLAAETLSHGGHVFLDGDPFLSGYSIDFAALYRY